MPERRIAYWMSEKKLQKINWNDFEKTCKHYGFSIFKLDLNKDLESQGEFCVLLHKLTDIIASADQGDAMCSNMIRKVEQFAAEHPSLVVVDPIPNVRQLLNRFRSYKKIKSTNLSKFGIFTPNFCELKSDNLLSQLRNANVSFPFICKPALGHGSRQAHKMSIIFNEKGLSHCKVPCVAQSFVNHNAVLYKLFIVGDRLHVVERPSLKNFQNCDDETTIHFDSGDVSKAGSTNSLTVLDEHEKDGIITQEPDKEILERIAMTLRDAFGMDLLGIDVVIENSTGKYAVIDVNAYPGYDGFPDFYDALLECINNKVQNNICKSGDY